MSSAFTLELLTALEEAYAKGILTVKYQDKLITYVSGKEMLARIQYMRRCLGLKAKTGRLFASHDKGLC